MADAEEWRAIEAILGPAKTDTDPEALALKLLYEQAQKLLLLAWLQEERYLEAIELIRRYDAGARRLASCLATGIDSGHMNQPISFRPAAEILVSWRIVAINAILFLPADMGIAVTGHMASELEEQMDFRAVPSNARMRICRTSAAEALGMPSSGLPQSIRESMLAEREWIMESAE